MLDGRSKVCDGMEKRISYHNPIYQSENFLSKQQTGDDISFRFQIRRGLIIR